MQIGAVEDACARPRRDRLDHRGDVHRGARMVDAAAAMGQQHRRSPVEHTAFTNTHSRAGRDALAVDLGRPDHRHRHARSRAASARPRPCSARTRRGWRRSMSPGVQRRAAAHRSGRRSTGPARRSWSAGPRHRRRRPCSRSSPSTWAIGRRAGRDLRPSAPGEAGAVDEQVGAGADHPRQRGRGVGIGASRRLNPTPASARATGRWRGSRPVTWTVQP